MKQRILLVEDETDLGNVVKQYLELMDFEVDWQQHGKTALAVFEQSPAAYHILVIDVNLPGMNGFELAQHIMQRNSEVPFLFLTARGEKNDRLQGLKIGADDYIVKPFDVDELVLRIRNIIKRKPLPGPPPGEGMAIGQTLFYKDSLKLIAGQQEIMLTPRECALLLLLLQHTNRVITREEILRRVWGSTDYFTGRSLDVFISRFRKYFRHDPAISIKNIYGTGFIFSVRKN